MKLFTRYFRINLIATLFIFLLASIAFYFLLWYVMIEQVDDDLKIEQREIETYVSKYQRPPEPITVKDQRITFDFTSQKEKFRHFSTIKFRDGNEHENFRQISFTLPIGNNWYLFKVSKSLEGTQSMNRSIIIISLVTVVVILLVSLLINRWQLRRLWQPFYSTLSGVQKFRLSEKVVPTFVPSSIDEFNVLNKTLEQFIQEAENEYNLLKEFTENASHELQTPLAVVQSTLDIMIQDENILKSQGSTLQTAYAAIQKMSKLNQSLLLLSKIENRQFSDMSSFDFRKLVEDKMNDWQELWQGRLLRVESELESTPVVMNIHLAEIMLNNLFSNAARHAAEGGSIYIKLYENRLEFSNTASNGSLDTEKLFKRFSKGGQSTDQHGLGLSIIKQIIEVSGKSVFYHFAEQKHFFIIHFK